MVDLEPIKQQIAKTEQDLANAMPTPPVGASIVWYERAIAQPDRVRAAIVTGIEAPGRLSITIFPPNSVPMHRKGVLHKSHPMHQQINNPTSQSNGSWDYLDGTTPPESHYELHRSVFRQKLETQRQQLAQAQEIADKEGDASSPKRGRIPDKVPAKA